MINSSHNSLTTANAGMGNIQDAEAIEVFERRLAELRAMKDKMESLFYLFISVDLDSILAGKDGYGQAGKESALFAR